MKGNHTMKSTLVFALLAMCQVAVGNPGISSTGTNGDEAVKIRAEFSVLARPLPYNARSWKREHITASWIELSGATRAFADRYSGEELIYALWPWLDDPDHAPEATILLLGITGYKLMRGPLTYVDQRHPGNWKFEGTGYVDECKIACRGALNQPAWWYPHKVLFDRDTVLSESKSNDVVRAAYVAAMQKVLTDSKIRTENPLGVREVLFLMYSLDRKASVPTFLDFLFFDGLHGQDFRRRSKTLPDDDIHKDGLTAGLAYLSRMGKEYVALVLRRFADATPEEMSVDVGGGAFPMLAVWYFHTVGLTEQEALKAIEQVKAENRSLSEVQKESLQMIADAVKSKKYRTRFMTRADWAVVSATNAPGAK